MFVAKSPKAKFAEEWMMRKLVIEKLKSRVDMIKVPVIAEFIFYFPETVYFTKAGPRSKKIPDTSNLYELPQDCLQAVGILENDTLVDGHDGSRRQPVNGSKYYLNIRLIAV
jgi:Holliday junction resolvase RusA-like endonuclease